MTLKSTKKRTCKIVDIVVTAEHRVKLKESRKKDKRHYFARELKKQLKNKVTIIRIVIGALAKVTKGLLKGLEDMEIRGRVEIIKATTLLRMARILRRIVET